MNFLKLFLALSIFSFNSFAAQEKSPKIIASINPIYQIALAILGDHDNTLLLIKPHFSEHNYQLKKSDMSNISKADLIFYIDGNVEKNLDKLLKNSAYKNKSFKLSTINNIKLLKQKSNVKEIDSHIWLDLQNAVVIAEFMAQKLAEIDPKNSKKYQENLQKFKDQIANLEKSSRVKLAKIKAQEHIFYYDTYQYFEEYFAIKSLAAISYDHDRELNFRDFKNLNKAIKSGKAKCIITDSWDEKNSALKLAQNHHLKFTIVDSLGRVEDECGYIGIIEDLVNAVSSCY